MKLKSILLPAVALAAAVLLNACASPEQPAVKEPDKLRPSLIYNIDSVKAFVDAKKGVDTTALQHLEKAKELMPLFPRKALYHVRNSITAKPTQEAYIQLATLLADVNEFTEARQAWKLLTVVFPSFDRKLYFEMLYVALCDPADGSLYPFYDLTLSSGIKKEEIRGFFLNEKRLESFRKTPKFTLLLEYFSPPADKDVSHDFYRFLQEFPRVRYWNTEKSYKKKVDYEEKSRLPLEIGLKELTSIAAEENSRIWSFREYIPEYRETHDYRGFQPVLRARAQHFRLDEGYEIILYAIDTSAYGASPEMRTIFYRLACVSWEGKVISSRIVAKHVGEELSTLKITEPSDGSYVFEVQHYKRSFKKPFNYKDNDNELHDTKTLDKEIITINEKGKIVSRKKK